MVSVKKILIANRGEIAIRIMRACRELGIKSVAVYSETDRNALFTQYADESYCIGPAEASLSYLNIRNIIAVAQEAGVDAIHPGYGFLAENPEFATACEKAGIIFIGPPSIVMTTIANKVNAKCIVKKCGLDTLPASEENIRDTTEALTIAREIGYPIILKAANGGGGRGMRIVKDESQLAKALELARSSVHTAFGDKGIFIEKFLDQPRHIEFQFMADRSGNVVCFGERECSIQMNHRKLIEESPSPAVTDKERQRMIELIRHLVKRIGYQNTGTAEFLYNNGKFYFIEINTRLQVEHTITEMLTGVDIVKEQILLAAGYPLSFSQQDIKPEGWAIECRINAEDPFNGFFPSVGTLQVYRSPGGVGIRVDSGISSNSTITADYDSLVSKVIAWGRTRDEAVERMKRALYEYVIIGIKTTIPFHLAVMNDPDFQAGRFSTNFIPQKKACLTEVLKSLQEDTRLLQDKIKVLPPEELEELREPLLQLSPVYAEAPGEEPEPMIDFDPSRLEG